MTKIHEIFFHKKATNPSPQNLLYFLLISIDGETNSMMRAVSFYTSGGTYSYTWFFNSAKYQHVRYF